MALTIRPIMGFVHPAHRIAAVGSMRDGATVLPELLRWCEWRVGGGMERGSRVSPDSTSIVGRPENAKAGGERGASVMLMDGVHGAPGGEGETEIAGTPTAMVGTLIAGTLPTEMEGTGGLASPTLIEGTAGPTLIDGTGGLSPMLMVGRGGDAGLPLIPVIAKTGGGPTRLGSAGLGETDDIFSLAFCFGTTPPIDTPAMRAASCSGLSSVIGEARRGDRLAPPAGAGPRSRLRLGETPTGGRGSMRFAPITARSRDFTDETVSLRSIIASSAGWRAVAGDPLAVVGGVGYE